MTPRWSGRCWPSRSRGLGCWGHRSRWVLGARAGPRRGRGRGESGAAAGVRLARAGLRSGPHRTDQSGRARHRPDGAGAWGAGARERGSGARWSGAGRAGFRASVECDGGAHADAVRRADHVRAQGCPVAGGRAGLAGRALGRVARASGAVRGRGGDAVAGGRGRSGRQCVGLCRVLGAGVARNALAHLPCAGDASRGRGGAGVRCARGHGRGCADAGAAGDR